MIGSFRNFAKTKFAGLLVVIMIIPFVFWGMGGMFSSGNTNNVAKINNINISTKELVNFIQSSNIPQKTIRDNLDKNIIEELLGGLISQKLLDLEIEDFNLQISEISLSRKIKTNKNFLNEKGKFERLRYEKFLLENNQSATIFEQKLKARELQKNLFDYIGAGTISPKFLTTKLFKDENRKITIDFISLNNFYKKKNDISEQDLQIFLSENKEKLKTEKIDFSYSIINPEILIGIDDFNQAFFDKIDEIEIDISNDLGFKDIVSKFNLQSIDIKDFQFSSNKNEIEKKIYKLKNIKKDIFENEDNYILYSINDIRQSEPDLENSQTKNEILNLIAEKNKFDYNRKLFEKIRDNNLSNNEFLKMAQNNLDTITLKSIKDNKKFEINAVELLYSLPEGKMTLINDNKNNIYLARIISFEDEKIDFESDIFKEYEIKQNSLNKNDILQSYDLFLNDKYNVTLNKQTIERVKNFFK